MKKMLMFAAAAAMVALSFTSCEKKPEPVDDLTIKLSQKTLDLAVGEEAKLRATVTPAKDGLTLVWKSTDEKVATVTSAGIVTGVETGECMIIVSAEGAKADTCVVTVSTIFDALEWSGFALFGKPGTTPLSEQLDTVTLTDNIRVVCGIYPANYIVWDKNVVMGDDGYLSGAGFAAFYDNVPTWVIVDELELGDPKYKGYPVNVGFLASYEGATVDSLSSLPNGKFLDLEKWAAYLFTEEGYKTLEESDCFQGAPIHYIDFDTENWEGYLYLGLVDQALFIGNYEGLDKYEMSVKWLDGAYGLKVTEDGEELVEPLTEDSHIQYYEYNAGAAVAPRAELCPIVYPKNDVKVSKYNLAKDKFARK